MKKILNRIYQLIKPIKHKEQELDYFSHPIIWKTREPNVCDVGTQSFNVPPGTTKIKITFLTLFLIIMASPANPLPTSQYSKFTWDPVVGATGYCLYWKEGITGTFTDVNKKCVTGTEISFTDLPIIVGSTKWFAVTSQKGSIESKFSPELQGVLIDIPLEPKNFKLTITIGL